MPMFLRWTALLVAVVCASATQATTVRQMSLSEVIGEAEVIAAARVVGVEPIWDADRGMPFTEVVYIVADVLKGQAGTDQELSLRFLGGPAPNGLMLSVSGMPSFAVGDLVVLFSARNGNEMICPLVGWWQGVYRLRDDGTVMDYAGRGVVAVDGEAGARVARTVPVEEADALTYDEFAALIRQEL